MKPVLIVYDEAERVASVAQPRFPDLEFVLVRSGPEVLPALEQHQPEVVFSLKNAGFPPEVHRPVIDHPSVRWVHVGGSGYEHFIPWDASRLLLTNSVGVLSRFVAETTIGAMLALNSGFPRYLEQQRLRQWKAVPFRPASEQTLLVVGLGAIGQWTALYAKGLGMRVLAIRRNQEPFDAVDEIHPPEALHRQLARADVVSVHIRADEQTRHLIDEKALCAMKPGALFMNTSRGMVVDEPALIAALESGHLRGAYLDVFETEPLPAPSPLWAMPNVIVTPHTADQVVDYPERFGALFADNLERWQAGKTLINQLPA